MQVIAVHIIPNATLISFWSFNFYNAYDLGKVYMWKIEK